MSFNRVKLFNEVAELREKTLAGAPLVEMLIRSKTIAKSLGDQGMIEWIESEMNRHEGDYYEADKNTRIGMVKLAPYRRIRVKFSFAEFSDMDKPQISVEDRNILYRAKLIQKLLLKERRRYTCTSPVGILEQSFELGVEVGIPAEHAEIYRKTYGEPVSDENALVLRSSSYIIPPDSIRGILDGVKGKLVDYFDKIIQGHPLNVIDVFYQSMDHIYDDVRKSYPDIAGEFETLHLNITQDKLESFSNVASACRRILKKFIDAERPPIKKETTPDGHPLTGGHELNRIKEWIKEKTAGTSQEKLVEKHSDYLDAIYGLTSKGDHNLISKHEAELCSVHTYLLLAELIRMKQERNHVDAEG